MGIERFYGFPVASLSPGDGGGGGGAAVKGRFESIFWLTDEGRIAMELKRPLLDGHFLLYHVSDYMGKSLLCKTSEPYGTCDYHLPYRGVSRRLQREMEELSEEKEGKAKKSGPGSNC